MCLFFRNVFILLFLIFIMFMFNFEVVFIKFVFLFDLNFEIVLCIVMNCFMVLMNEEEVIFLMILMWIVLLYR